MGAGRQGAQAPYPPRTLSEAKRKEEDWRREGKGGKRRGRKRKEPLDAGAGSVTDYKPYNKL